MSNPVMRRLGTSGLAVSPAGLGCNNLGRTGTVTAELGPSRAVVDAAIDAGITLFDVADIYGAEPGVSEAILGIALGKRRDRVVLATKFGMDAKGANGPDDGARGSRRYILQSIDASLRRLKTDWIDLYQIHRPDPMTPLEETLSALDDLVRSGKVRYIGHSNFSGWQLADAAWLARSSHSVPFISAQNEYSLVRREVESELIPAATRFGVGILPFFPLANGLLTGKFRQGRTAPAGTRLADLKPTLLESAPWVAVEQLAAYAEARDLTMVQVAFGWLLAQPQVGSVIAGATTPEQVVANAAASTSWTPTASDLTELDVIFPPSVAVQ